MGFIALSTFAFAPIRCSQCTASRSAPWPGIAGACARIEPTLSFRALARAGARDHIELWDGLWDFLRLVSWLED